MRFQSYRLVTAVLLISGLLGLAVPSTASAQTPCTFTHGFKVLHDAIPDVVGPCIESEQPFPSGVGSKQRTTNGRLDWANFGGTWSTFFYPYAYAYSTPSYTLQSYADCTGARNGVYLPSGVCIAISPWVEIPQSTIDQGYSAKAICEQSGKLFFGTDQCALQIAQ